MVHPRMELDPRTHYRQARCDAMAIALHRATGLPLIAWAGEYGPPGDSVREAFHMGVGDSRSWLDVDGGHGEPPMSLLIGEPDDVVAVVLRDEHEARHLFSVDGVSEQDVAAAAALAMDLGLLEPPECYFDMAC